MQSLFLSGDKGKLTVEVHAQGQYKPSQLFSTPPPPSRLHCPTLIGNIYITDEIYIYINMTQTNSCGHIEAEMCTIIYTTCNKSGHKLDPTIFGTGQYDQEAQSILYLLWKCLQHSTNAMCLFLSLAVDCHYLQ